MEHTAGKSCSSVKCLEWEWPEVGRVEGDVVISDLSHISKAQILVCQLLGQRNLDYVKETSCVTRRESLVCHSELESFLPSSPSSCHPPPHCIISTTVCSVVWCMSSTVLSDLCALVIWSLQPPCAVSITTIIYDGNGLSEIVYLR